MQHRDESCTKFSEKLDEFRRQQQAAVLEMDLPPLD